MNNPLRLVSLMRDGRDLSVHNPVLTGQETIENLLVIASKVADQLDRGVRLEVSVAGRFFPLATVFPSPIVDAIWEPSN